MRRAVPDVGLLKRLENEVGIPRIVFNDQNMDGTTVHQRSPSEIGGTFRVRVLPRRFNSNLLRATVCTAWTLAAFGCDLPARAKPEPCSQISPVKPCWRNASYKTK